MATYTKIITTTTHVAVSYLIDETETGEFEPKYDKNIRSVKTTFEDVELAEWEEISGIVKSLQNAAPAPIQV